MVVFDGGIYLVYPSSCMDGTDHGGLVAALLWVYRGPTYEVVGHLDRKIFHTNPRDILLCKTDHLMVGNCAMRPDGASLQSNAYLHCDGNLDCADSDFCRPHTIGHR